MDAFNEKLYCNYKIYAGHHLIVETYKGTMTLQKMIRFKSLQSRDLSFNHNMDMMCDIRNLICNGTTQEVEEYIDFIVKNGNLKGKGKAAIVYNTPNQHAYALILERSKKLPLEIKLFTSIDFALLWLNKDFDSNNFEFLLFQLKKEASLITT